MTVAFTTSLDGWFKNVYAASWEDAVPEWAIAAQLIPFGNQERLGKQYNFPVLLRRSHGDTFTGTTGAAVTLNDAVSMVMDEATVQGSGYVLQEDVTYETLSRAAAGGKAAFGDVMEVIVGSMRSTTDYKRELALLYGNSTGVAPWDIGIGTTTTIFAAAASINFTVTEASWASGIWAQSEGMFVDMYNGVTLQNASPQTLQVAAVNHATRTVTLTVSPGVLDIATGDYLVPRGAFGTWFDGIHSILSNTGTQFGIPGATFSQWLAQTYGFGSAKLSFGKIMKAVARAVGKGLMDDVVVICNHDGWTDLANDMAALRRFGDAAGQKDVQFGTKAITFYGPNGGTVTLKPHPMQMQGFAPIIVPSQWKRRGSTDTTFRLPGVGDGKAEPAMWMPLESKQAVRFRSFWDQCLICTKPSSQVLGTGIVNNT